MEASCLARLVQPFMKLVHSRAALDELVPLEFRSAHPDSRVSLIDAHEMLERGVDQLRDRHLGLNLGASMIVGAGGVFDYAIRSAPTLGASLRVASRYSPLMADTFHIGLEQRGGALHVQVGNELSFPPAVADFSMAALFKLHLREFVSAGRLQCHFGYSAPSDLTEHERVFPGAVFRFGSSFTGFVLEPGDEGMALPGTDPALHELLRVRLDAALSDLGVASTRRFSTMVRRMLRDQIRAGEPSAESTARALRMSRRTLARRLEQERTHFVAELDAVRRQLAFEHVQDAHVPLTEVAFRSGFSHVESFHRAFRRWTGQTPLTYRQAALRS